MPGVPELFGSSGHPSAILGAMKVLNVAEIGDATEVAFLRLKLLKEAHKPDRTETFVVGFG